MSIRKFHGIEEMKAPRWRESGDPEIVRAMARLWEIARRTRIRHFPPGVHKHRSIEEMNGVQERWAEHPTGS